MPWTGTSIRKHNHSLSGAKAAHAARIANAVLKSSGNDGTALAVASKWAKQHRRAPGGSVPMKDAQFSYFPERDWTDRLPPMRSGDERMERKPPPGSALINRPDPYPNDVLDGFRFGGRRASGGPAPQAPTYQTAAPAVNAQGFVPVPQGGTYNLDLTTGAMQPTSRANLQAFAQRGLPIVNPNAPPAPSPADAGWAALQAIGVQPNFSRGLPFNPSPLPQMAPANPSFNPSALPQMAPANPSSGAAQLQAIGVQPDWSIFNGGGGGESGGGSDGGGGAMRRGGRRAAGGPSPMSLSQATPWWTRSEAHGEGSHPAGLIPGASGGRQDNVPMNLAPHSHVIPADVVSGWGQGNTSAGAVALQHALSTGPYGTALPKVPTRPPRALIAPAPHMPKLARGGSSEGVRTLVSHGEIIVPPEDVYRIGGGDFEKGHDWLDRLIVDSRKQIIAHTRKLPGPVKE